MPIGSVRVRNARSPGCTYRSGECDENAPWQWASPAEKTPSRTRRPTPRPLRPSLRPGSPRRAIRPICRTTTITGTPMLVDQRRSDAPPAAGTVSRCSVPSPSPRTETPVPLGSDVRRVVAYLAVHRRPQRRAAARRGPLAGRHRRLGAAPARRGTGVGRRRGCRGRAAGHGAAAGPRTRTSRSTSTRRWRWSASWPARPAGPRTVPADGLRTSCWAGHPARLDRGLAGRRARAVPPDPAQRARGAQRRAERAGRHDDAVALGRGGRAHRARAGTAPAARSSRRTSPRARSPRRSPQYDEYQELLRSSVGARAGERVRPGRAAAARARLAGSAGRVSRCRA